MTHSQHSLHSARTSTCDLIRSGGEVHCDDRARSLPLRSEAGRPVGTMANEADGISPTASTISRVSVYSFFHDNICHVPTTSIVPSIMVKALWLLAGHRLK
jgi:hypothetical protein